MKLCQVLAKLSEFHGSPMSLVVEPSWAAAKRVAFTWVLLSLLVAAALVPAAMAATAAATHGSAVVARPRVSSATSRDATDGYAVLFALLFLFVYVAVYLVGGMGRSEVELTCAMAAFLHGATPRGRPP